MAGGWNHVKSCGYSHFHQETVRLRVVCKWRLFCGVYFYFQVGTWGLVTYKDQRGKGALYTQLRKWVSWMFSFPWGKKNVLCWFMEFGVWETVFRRESSEEMKKDFSLPPKHYPWVLKTHRFPSRFIYGIESRPQSAKLALFFPCKRWCHETLSGFKQTHKLQKFTPFFLHKIQLRQWDFSSALPSSPLITLSELFQNLEMLVF